jgi:tetratricopeptide (TPR) repeat protein
VNEAVDAWENTVRIRPEFARGHENLGFALYAQGKYSEALTHLRLAYAGEPNRVYALTLAATLLATCPDAALRNGAEALTLAEQAEKMTGGRDPSVLDTVSAAYADNGAFGQAIETEEQALALAGRQGDVALEVTLNAHLAKYASNEALREPPDSGSF